MGTTGLSVEVVFLPPLATRNADGSLPTRLELSHRRATRFSRRCSAKAGAALPAFPIPCRTFRVPSNLARNRCHSTGMPRIWLRRSVGMPGEAHSASGLHALKLQQLSASSATFWQNAASASRRYMAQ